MLFSYVKRGFEHLQSGEQVIQQLRTLGAGLIRVGISNTLCKYLFVPYLEKFHRKYPNIRFNIVNRTSSETLELLFQGRIDFGIISLPENKERLVCHELLTIQDVFVAGENHYPELCGPQTVESLSRYPLMTLEENNVSRNYMDRFFISHGLLLKPEIEISSFDFLIDFARIGLGVGLVIRNFIKEELKQGVIREIELDPTIPKRSVGIVMLKGVPLSTASKTFLDSICHSFC